MKNRKFIRFRTQDNAFAALRGDFTKVGKIYDISLNGLGFRYLAEQESEEKLTHVDIFMSDKWFHLPDVSCNIVYDVKEHTSNSLEISPYRCGLKFNALLEEDQNKLEYFLNNYTTVEV